MKQQIGFIGLGKLGTPIAMNIVESGHNLYVYNRTTSKTAPLAAKGAKVSNDIAGLAADCDIIFTMLSDDAALKNVCEGKDGLLKHMKPGSIHVSMSTILPQTATELTSQHEQKQQHYIAAPVFGRPEAATARKLNFAVSGKEEIRKSIQPLLEDAGAVGVWHFGEDVSAANTIKLCGNFLIASAIEAIGESVSLANKSGVDAQLMWDMFTQTLFNAPIYVNYSKIVMQQKFEPAAFTAKLGLKDLNLVLQQAAAVDVFMPTASLLKESMQLLVSKGKADIDWSAVAVVAQEK